jgi:hypothetical protein
MHSNIPPRFPRIATPTVFTTRNRPSGPMCDQGPHHHHIEEPRLPPFPGHFMSWRRLSLFRAGADVEQDVQDAVERGHQDQH